MPADLDPLFAAMTRDADSRLLADPHELRHSGEHRARVRRLATVAGTLATMLLAGTIALVVTSTSTTIPPVQPTPNLTTPTELTASPNPTATSPGPGPTTPSSSPTAQVVAHRDCQPTDLDPRPWYIADGAHGMDYLGVIVQNRSATACLMGGSPKLLVTDSTGHLTPFPYNSGCPTCPIITVVPGGYAEFTINSYIDPRLAPATCTGPVGPFHGLVVQWVTGPQYPLPGFTPTLTCGWADVGGWETVTDPLTSAPTVTRAPMPTNTPSP
jgi:hypothetical protein